MVARTLRRVLIVIALTAGVAATGLGVAPQATSASRWAPAATATIHPGVLMTSPAGRCTASFVFYDGPELYLTFAAHCAGQGEIDDIDGCSTASLPLGTPVAIEGATRPGTLVYSSWMAMQGARASDPALCEYNDFAVVRIDPADRGRVNPSVPHWGGPFGIARRSLSPLEPVYGFGNSPLRQGIELLQPKTGLSIEELGGGRSHMVLMATPGIPGDSGSALMDQHGAAIGVASTIALAPIPASNNYTDLRKAVAYAKAHGMPGLLLAFGTEPFNPNQLPLG